MTDSLQEPDHPPIWSLWGDSVMHTLGRLETIMVDPARRARILRDLQQDFIPDYDAQSLPSADKRAAYALEHIAFRLGRIEHSLGKIAAALESVLLKA
jgi:hypothetical protein